MFSVLSNNMSKHQQYRTKDLTYLLTRLKKYAPEILRFKTKYQNHVTTANNIKK